MRAEHHRNFEHSIGRDIPKAESSSDAVAFRFDQFNGSPVDQSLSPECEEHGLIGVGRFPGPLLAVGSSVPISALILDALFRCAQLAVAKRFHEHRRC